MSVSLFETYDFVYNKPGEGDMSMTPEQIKEAKLLLKDREDLIEALRHDLVNERVGSINTATDWAFGAGVRPMKQQMMDSRKLCAVVANIIMTSKAKELLAEVEETLKLMGVDLTDDTGEMTNWEGSDTFHRVSIKGEFKEPSAGGTI